MKNQEKVTYVYFAIDGSNSMYNCFGEALDQLELNIKTLTQDSAKFDINTFYSVYLFGYENKTVKELIPLSSVKSNYQNLNYLTSKYLLGNSTPLLDAVDHGLNLIKNNQDYINSNSNASFLLVTITDGEENSSKISKTNFKKNINTILKNNDKVTLAFLVPPGATKEITNFGIPEGNVAEWDNTVKGAKEAGTKTNQGLSNYINNRSTGVLRTNSFYVTTDLSKVTKKDLKNLVDLSKQFKSYTVDKETPIKEFVENKTKSTYIFGSVYYQLTKKEDVQANKSILIKDKATNKLYGGSEARDLLNLTSSGTSKVTPGNHSNYEIYVQSKSINRKLVRGTNILVDQTHVYNSPDLTWDHNKAKTSTNGT